MDGGSLPIFPVFFFREVFFSHLLESTVRYSAVIIVAIGYRYELLLMR